MAEILVWKIRNYGCWWVEDETGKEIASSLSSTEIREKALEIARQRGVQVKLEVVDE